MNLLLATILLVGWTTADPSEIPEILKELKSNLEMDIKFADAMALESIDQIVQHIQEGIKIMSKNPWEGRKILIRYLYKDFQDIYKNYKSEYHSVYTHVKEAIHEIQDALKPDHQY